jgi:two-component system sensor histidine kinase CreC
MEPFIENSRQAILRQGWILLGLSFLVGLGVTWWLSRSLATLGRYAKAVTEGERVAAPDLGRNEIGDLGRTLATMRERLDGKQYVEQYVQTLAHEMKSPLAAIRGAAEILGDSPPGPDRERFLRNIEGQVQRMATMIDRMLALAAVEFRQDLRDPEPVDLAVLVRECIETSEPRIERRRLRVELEPTGGSAIVSGDRFLLGQALGNLLDNAIEFSPEGGSIRFELARDGNDWRLRIDDAGPGIPGFALERVFERFYSLPRPEGGRSSGIGLGFVREVATLHGGSVTLGNRDEGGARAELRRPAR